VRVGCLAQIINVIAPLMTNDEGVLRQTIYYPYAWALEHAHGRVLDLLAALSHTADFSVGCYCEDEARCHRSILRRLLKERGAKLR